MTRFDQNGKLPFPTLIPLDGKPLVMTTGVLKRGGKPVLAVIVDKDGVRSLVIRDAEGKTKTRRLSDSFKANPVSISIHDVNQDGRPDLVVLIPYEKIKVLLQKTAGDFDEVDVDPPGGPMEQPWLAAVDTAGDGREELLLPQKNFVRSVVLEQQAKIVRPDQRPRLGVPREGPDQRRRARLADHWRHRRGQRHQSRRRHFSAGCGAQATDPVRARLRRRLAGGA